jgi:nickel-dependent lactate racemase
MRVAIPFGQPMPTLDIPSGRLIELRRPQAPAEPLLSPAAAVGYALEHPHNFPPLRRALTAEDRVAIVVDEELPNVASLLTPILDHITSAEVSPEAITLLCPPSSGGQPWLEGLPESYEEVHVETHQPQDRARLCYLAATGQGKRLYLNRTLAEADQLVVLSGRGYDPLTGYSGAEASLFPQFGDEGTRHEAVRQLSLNRLGTDTALLDEAIEVAWLLGAPFLVQVLVGTRGAVTHVLAGLMTTSSEGRRLLDEEARFQVERAADVIVAVVPGDPGPNDFQAVARALGIAARVVRPNGRIVLLTRRQPRPGDSARLFSKSNNPGRALDFLRREPPVEAVAAYLWLSAAQRATVHLHCGLPGSATAELFVTPLPDAEQIQDSIPADALCLILPEADRVLVDVGSPPIGATKGPD